MQCNIKQYTQLLGRNTNTELSSVGCTGLVTTIQRISVITRVTPGSGVEEYCYTATQVTHGHSQQHPGLPLNEECLLGKGVLSHQQ